MKQADKFKNLIQEYLSQSQLLGFLSINEIKEKQSDGKKVSAQEQKALANFDAFRIRELNVQQSEEAFHVRYRELQVMANLFPYEEFLKEDYHNSHE